MVIYFFGFSVLINVLVMAILRAFYEAPRMMDGWGYFHCWLPINIAIKASVVNHLYMNWLPLCHGNSDD